MSNKLKVLARLAVAAILTTGIFAGSSGPTNAAPETHHHHPVVVVFDTGWG